MCSCIPFKDNWTNSVQQAVQNLSPRFITWRFSQSSNSVKLVWSFFISGTDHGYRTNDNNAEETCAFWWKPWISMQMVIYQFHYDDTQKIDCLYAIVHRLSLGIYGNHERFKWRILIQYSLERKYQGGCLNEPNFEAPNVRVFGMMMRTVMLHVITYWSLFEYDLRQISYLNTYLSSRKCDFQFSGLPLAKGTKTFVHWLKHWRSVFLLHTSNYVLDKIRFRSRYGFMRIIPSTQV